MDDFTEKMARQVRTTPPTCLSGFRTSPSHADEWDDWAVWSLACSCGATKGKLMGHPLKECDPEYDGPPLFVSPLAFLCSSCGKTTEIIDTKKHGYNSEVGKDEEGKSWDSNYRGTGQGQPVPCPACGGSEFEIMACCSHSHFDLIEDEPELAPRAQEFFDAFECRGGCAACGEDASLADFELA